MAQIGGDTMGNPMYRKDNSGTWVRVFTGGNLKTIDSFYYNYGDEKTSKTGGWESNTYGNAIIKNSDNLQMLNATVQSVAQTQVKVVLNGITKVRIKYSLTGSDYGNNKALALVQIQPNKNLSVTGGSTSIALIPSLVCGVVTSELTFSNAVSGDYYIYVGVAINNVFDIDFKVYSIEIY